MKKNVLPAGEPVLEEEQTRDQRSGDRRQAAETLLGVRNHVEANGNADRREQ